MRAVAPVPVPLWDLPTRLFHWLLVVLVAALWVSGEFDVLSLHLVLGPVVLTLLLFRLAWGVVGSSSARFATFVRGPAAALAYLRALRRGESWPGLGHNPLGAYSVVALLGMLAVQGATGLFASDDVITEGPLAALVSAKTVALLSSLHRLGFKALLGLILLHVGAIAFYRWVKKEDLVRPMLTGTKPMPPGTPGVVFVSPWRALVVAVVAAGLVFGGLRLAG